MDEAGHEELLRRELRELRDELDTLGRDTSKARAALREPYEPGADALPGPKQRSVLIMLPATVAPVVIIAAIFVFGGGGQPSSETLYGRVREATGNAPAAVGGRCTVFVREDTDSDSSFDTQITVLCDRHVVYGGGSKGYIECGRTGDVLLRCTDGSYTHDGGDPRLEFDRARRRVRVDDPTWAVEIELTTPPAGVGSDDGRL